MTETLGKSVLELEANLTPFRKGVSAAKGDADDLRGALEALAAVANISEKELNRLGLHRSAAVESDVSAETIIKGVRGIGEESRRAARDLDDVKLDSANAAETTAAGDLIDHKLKEITGNANEARRSLESVNLASAGAGGGGRGIGLLGAGIGAGTLLGPAAGPGAIGLLAAVPVLATTGAGALGTLALAFAGVGKAIGGDKKAFDALEQSQQQFVLTVRSLDGWLDKLKQTAGSNLFPGLTDALHSALSPGTMAAVTQAVKEFAFAIGQAGQAWGLYFGSAEFQSIFGPLMAEGAHNLTVLAAAALSLFDAMGVLARAAIPFTSWMTEGIAKGSQLADAWMHAQDASGGLTRGLNEAETSLRLVGNLFVSLGRAVYELGAALYPVSKVAVKDLTDGLNFLAGVFDRNKQTIRDIVSGALAALVSTIKTLWPIVAKLAEALNAVAKAVGGWKTAFELVISGFLYAKFVGLAGGVAMVGQASKAAAIETGGLRAVLLSLGDAPVLAALALAAAAVYGVYQSITTQTYPGVKPSGTGANATSSGSKVYTRNGVTNQVNPGAKPGRGEPFTGIAEDGSVYKNGKLVTRGGTVGPGGAHSGASSVGPNVVSGSGDFADETPAFKNALNALATRYGPINLNSGFRDETKQTQLWDASVNAGHPGFMPNGNPIARPKSRGGSGSDHSRGTAGDGSIFYKGKWTPLSSLPPSVLQAYGLSTVPGDVGHVMLAGAASGSPFGVDPAFTKNLGPKAPKPPKPTMPTGANLLPEALRNALQNAKDKATTTQGATAAVWLHTELDDLDKARANLEAQLKGSSGKKKAAIEAELRSIDGQIATVTKGITTNLNQQAAAIKTSFASKISAAKSNISSAVGLLKQTLDTQFQTATQTYIDTVLGPQFAQGTDTHGVGLQTPLEKQLADMQAADTLKGLQDAVAAATDPASRDAAQRQLDEYRLGIQATAERNQSDYDYAQAVKKYQADRTEAERQMNLQLDQFGRGLAAGTSSLGDLAAIAGEWGLSLTADGGIVDDFGTLSNAVTALSDVMFAKSVALGGIGDTSDAHKAALAAAGLVIPSGASTLIPGTNIDFAGFVAAAMTRNQIPKLDAGGTVLETGLAVVHRGETYSGVGSSRMGGDSPQVTVNGFVGNEAELAVVIGQLLQNANRRGIKFGIQ